MRCMSFLKKQYYWKIAQPEEFIFCKNSLSNLYYSSIYVVICKYDLKKPFSIMNISEKK